MEKKIQKAVLQYIKKCKEVTRSQVIGEVSKLQGCERIGTQEAINILIDDKKIHIVGLADTLALTRKGYESLESLPKKILYFVRDNFFSLFNIVKK